MARGKLIGKRRPNIAKTLTDSAVSAFLGMIEIHNKPRIEYRYPTSTILMVNSWELILKAYIHKYVSPKRIWKDRKRTITITESLELLQSMDLTQFSKNEIILLKTNVESLEAYRNEFIHYNINELDPIVFGLLYKSTVLFCDFLKKGFNKDITSYENLIILPIGLKLPYDPINFLKQATLVKNDFYTYILEKTKELINIGVEDSIFVSLDAKFESIKNIKNADIIVGLGQNTNAQIDLVKTLRLSNEPSAQSVSISDEQLMKEFPLTYKSVVQKVKEKKHDFKTGNKFHKIMASIKQDKTMVYERKLNPLTKKTSKTFFYKEVVVDEIIKIYFKK